MKINAYFKKLLIKAGHKAISLGNRFEGYTVKILSRNDNWILCKANNHTWRLDKTQYIDGTILHDGVFEVHLTRMVSHLVKPGMVIVDVGANIGYYTVQFSKLTGQDGKVYAFEPSIRFRDRLKEHLSLNKCVNVEICEFGLSDKDEAKILFESGDTATIYWVDDEIKPVKEQTIKLMTLDRFVAENKLKKVDLIKVDIDGYEPNFINGAIETLKKFQPIILIEFAQLHLVKAGSSCDLLAKQLIDLGYDFYSEKTGELYSNYTKFLVDSMNCSYSVNVICLPKSFNKSNVLK